MGIRSVPVLSPDKRKHRGAHPSDAVLFDAERAGILRLAASDFSWLLSRGYRSASSLKLVGDRYALRERQRLAVARAACSDESLARRDASRLEARELEGAHLIVDGFNLIITIEAALSGGVVLVCRDRCLRDLSSVHGSYRAVEETERALHLIGEAMAELAPSSALWLLDRPVSNSGRLAERIRRVATERGWPWEVEVDFDPDRRIVSSRRVAVTSDSNVLDGASGWFNFNAHLVTRRLPLAWLVDLSV